MTIGTSPRPRTNSRSAKVERRLSASLALASRTQAELSPARRVQACSGDDTEAVNTRTSSGAAPSPPSPLEAGSCPAMMGISISFSSISSTRNCLTTFESVSVFRKTSL